MEADEIIEQVSGASKVSHGPDILAKTVAITWETAAILIVTAATLASRLWLLGARVMSHDESLHVYFSWLLSTGKGFVHNPMMHGPLLFESTAVIDALLGASDFTSRLVPALLGTLIVVAVPQLLKKWLGSAGALGASLLFLISPFILYYSRYIRHDIIVIAWVLAAVVLIFRHLERPSPDNLPWLAAALALMLSTMEISFIYMAIFAGFLFIKAALQYRISWRCWRASPEFEILVTLITLGGLFSSPIALPLLNPIWARLSGAPFVDLQALSVQDAAWSSGVVGTRLWGLFGAVAFLCAVLGLRWDWRRWLTLAGIFLGITIPLFTTFFSNPAGLGTGFIGSLGYWLSQQSVARGSQPWYYFLIVLPLYEYLPIAGGALAAITYFISGSRLPTLQRTFVQFLLWWSVAIFAALTLAGEKMPWLSTHLVVPLILLTSWWIGRAAQCLWGSGPQVATRRSLMLLAPLAVLILLAVLTVRTSIAVNYVNYDYVTEYIDYAHGAPGVKWTVDDIAAIADHTGAGRDLKVAYDDEVSWPMTWYLRNYRNQAFYGSTPDRSALDAAVVIAGPKNWTKVESILGSGYHRFEVIRLWWPIEDYKNLTWDRIRNALVDPSMRAALRDIFWDRDYRQYAQITGQSLDPPVDWPLAERMRVYVRKDIASQMLGMDLGPSMLADVPEPVDAYAGLQRPLQSLQVIAGGGLNGPRGLALAPDGSIYVADTGNSRIVHFDAAGEVLAAWGSRTPDGQLPPAPGTFVEPWGIATDAQGNVFVADTWNHRVQKFDPSGKFLLEWRASGQPSDGPYGLWGPRGIAVSPDGRVYLTDTGNKRVLVFDSDGRFLFEFQADGEGKLDEPVGIALGPDGNVYVADTWNSRVSVFTANGSFKAAWSVQAWNGASLDNKPYIAVDAQSRVYITDPEAYRLIVFSSTGVPLATYGQYGTAPDSFGLPVGVASGRDGSLWIADAGNNRLQELAVGD